LDPIDGVQDSCDEYPFAKSKEGSKPADQCAEIVPDQLADGTWEVHDFTFAGHPTNFSEPCVRSHVPLSENTDAGGEFGRLVQSDRILDDDAFTVTVPDVVSVLYP
jgi:hypothetical protein